jgi:hypothetical protein
MSERTARVALLLITLLFVLWGLFYIHRTSALVGGSRMFLLWDDGMISMRYARNLAEGHGLTWNPDGEKVQGISNLGLTLVMALIHLLPVDPLRTSLVFQLLCLGLAAACLPFVNRLALVLFDDRAVGVAATFATAIFGPFAIWSLQGADVAAVALPVIAALVWVVEAERRQRPWPTGAFPVLAAAVLVRLDAALVYVIVLAYCLWREGAASRAFRRGLILLVALGTGVLAFGYLYYGDPLPNTYYLKATGSPRLLMWQKGLSHTLYFVTAVSPLLLILMVAALLPRLRRDRPLVLTAAMVLSAFAYNAWVGGDWISRLPSRFLTPVLPLLITLILGAWWLACRALHLRALRAWWLYGAGALAIAIQINPHGSLSEWLSFDAETLYKETNTSNALIGIYLRLTTDPRTTVAYHWAGTAAYFAERPGIDVLGKSDRHIAKLRVDRFEPGHSKWDWGYVVGERRPDVFIGQSRGLLRRDDFNRDYRAALTGRGDWIFVRRGSEGRLYDKKITYFEISSIRQSTPES